MILSYLNKKYIMLYQNGLSTPFNADLSLSSQQETDTTAPGLLLLSALTSPVPEAETVFPSTTPPPGETTTTASTSSMPDNNVYDSDRIVFPDFFTIQQTLISAATAETSALQTASLMPDNTSTQQSLEFTTKDYKTSTIGFEIEFQLSDPTPSNPTEMNVVFSDQSLMSSQDINTSGGFNPSDELDVELLQDKIKDTPNYLNNSSEKM